MKRETTSRINWILDNLVPPIIRDNRFFMRILFYPVFGNKSSYFLNFKGNLHIMTPSDLQNYYKILDDQHIERDTDLTQKSIDLISSNIEGKKVLDIACGTGYLTNILDSKFDIEITGADFNISGNESNDSGNIIYTSENIENMSFQDNSFDTVICAHTLEHTLDIQSAIKELRRVARHKIIIVVPRQREYKYTFDLHTHFFPDLWKLLNLMNNKNGSAFYCLNDIVYIEKAKVEPYR